MLAGRTPAQAWADDPGHQHPGLAGPMALRRVPPATFTLTARLDVLTAGRQRAIQSTASWTNVPR